MEKYVHRQKERRRNGYFEINYGASTFDPILVVSTGKVNRLLSNNDLKIDLICTFVNFRFLKNTIKQLEIRKMILVCGLGPIEQGVEI